MYLLNKSSNCMNKLMMSKKIESAIKILKSKKKQREDALWLNSAYTYGVFINILKYLKGYNAFNFI